MTSGTATIATTPDTIMTVLADLPGMLAWSPAQSVEVTESDDAGRPRQARWRERYGPLQDEFVLRYQWHDRAVSWWLLHGRILKRENGRFELDALRCGGTQLTYSLELGIVVPLPPCVRTRIESLVIASTLESLKKHVECR